MLESLYFVPVHLIESNNEKKLMSIIRESEMSLRQVLEYQLCGPHKKNHIYRLLRRDCNGVEIGDNGEDGLQHYVQVSVKNITYLLQEATAVFLHDITI